MLYGECGGLNRMDMYKGEFAYRTSNGLARSQTPYIDKPFCCVFWTLICKKVGQSHKFVLPSIKYLFINSVVDQIIYVSRLFVRQCVFTFPRETCSISLTISSHFLSIARSFSDVIECPHSIIAHMGSLGSHFWYCNINMPL